MMQIQEFEEAVRKLKTRDSIRYELLIEDPCDGDAVTRLKMAARQVDFNDLVEEYEHWALAKRAAEADDDALPKLG